MELHELIEHCNSCERSPVVARVAEAYLSLGKQEDASALCRYGFASYPSYSTLILIYAKCYASAGQFRQAVELITGVCEQYPGVPSLKKLYEEWSQEIMRQPAVSDEHAPLPIETAATAHTEQHEDAEVKETLQSSAQAEEETSHKILHEEIHVESSKELERDGVAETSSAPILGEQPEEIVEEGDRSGEIQEIERNVEPPLQNEEGRIITKTLAEIYVQQGQLAEAITIYELLKQSRPEYAGEADRRLRELRGAVDSEHTPP